MKNSALVTAIVLTVGIVVLIVLGVVESGGDGTRPATPSRDPLNSSANGNPGDVDRRSPRIEPVPYREPIPDDLESSAQEESVPEAPLRLPCVTPDDLQIYERLLEGTKSVPEKAGTSPWSEASYGKIPPHLSLFTITEMDLDRAVDFYKIQLLESVGQNFESLSADDTLKTEVEVLTSAWFLSRTLHQKLGWVSDQLRQGHHLPGDREHLEELSQRLRGSVGTSVSWYARMSKRFYDEHLSAIDNR